MKHKKTMTLREWRNSRGISTPFLAKIVKESYGIEITPAAIATMETKPSYPRYDLGVALQKMADRDNVIIKFSEK